MSMNYMTNLCPGVFEKATKKTKRWTGSWEGVVFLLIIIIYDGAY